MKRENETNEISETNEKLFKYSFVSLISFVSFSLLAQVFGAPIDPPLHKVHISVAHIEYKQPSQSVEIVIRVFADDLENALSKRANRPVKIDPATADKNREAGELAIAYLRENFELKSRAGKAMKLAWVGMDGQADMFWIYLDGKMPGGIDGAQLRNRIFCEIFDDQVNIVNARHRGKQIGLMFDRKDGFKSILQTGN